MSEYDAQISRALGTDEGWETLFEKDYSYISNKDDELKAHEEYKSVIKEFIEKTNFYLHKARRSATIFSVSLSPVTY